MTVVRFNYHQKRKLDISHRRIFWESPVNEILAEIPRKPTIFCWSVEIVWIFFYRYFTKESYFTTLMDAMKTSRVGWDTSAAHDTEANKTCLHSSIAATSTTEPSRTSPPEQNCWFGTTISTLSIWASHWKYVKLPPANLLVRKGSGGASRVFYC